MMHKTTPVGIRGLKEALKQNKKTVLIRNEKTKEELKKHENYNFDGVVVNLEKFQMRDSPNKDEAEYNLSKLKNAIGSKGPIVKIEEFKNWGETQTIHVISSYPTTVYDIQTLVKAAADIPLRVRCAGRGHSWGPIFSDSNQLLIHMNEMKGIYDNESKIKISDKKNCIVDIMTGVTTGDFKDFQLEKKLNIPANVILDVVQMVSVVATGCHGVGWDVKAPCDYVQEMRIINSKGTLITYTDSSPEMFNAVRANFGCFGVIIDMKMKLTPAFDVEVNNEYMKLEEILKGETLYNLFKKNWSVEIFWFPFNSFDPFGEIKMLAEDEVWIRKINPKEGENKHEFYYELKNMVDWVSQEVLEHISPVIANHPSLAPWLARPSFCAIQHINYPTGPIHQELPHAIHFRNHIDKAPVYDMEFAFNFDKTKLIDIISVVTKKVDDYQKYGQYPLNIALEMRVMGHSEALLCPGIIGNTEYGGSGQVLFIEVLSVVNTKQWTRFCTEVGLKWMKLGGIPHLAKQWDFLPDIEDHIYKSKKLQIDEFTKQLKESKADPGGMFLNESIKRLLRL